MYHHKHNNLEINIEPNDNLIKKSGLGTLMVYSKKGHHLGVTIGGRKYCNMFFTTDRLKMIFASDNVIVDSQNQILPLMINITEFCGEIEMNVKIYSGDFK